MVFFTKAADKGGTIEGNKIPFNDLEIAHKVIVF